MSSEIRRNRRKLRRAGKRIICEAYKRHEKGFINMITAPTNTGKTYNIQNELIPSDIEMGITHFLYITTATDNVEQEYADFQESLFGKAKIVRDLDEFLDYTGKHPIVLIHTIAGATNRQGERNNPQEILNYLEDKPFAVFWDEAHYGGSSSQETQRYNTGTSKKKKNVYNATYFNFMEKCAKLNGGSGKVTSFSATALFEQMELLRGIVNTVGIYKLLNTKEEWVTLDELTEISSQVRLIHKYDNFETGIKKGLLDFFGFSEYLSINAEAINLVHPELKLTPKPVALINVAPSNNAKESARNMKEAIDIVSNICTKIGDQDTRRFGKVSENGYFIASVNDMINDTWKRVRTHHEFVKAMKDSDNPLQIVFHVNKFQTGLNCENITHQIHLRKRSQKAQPGTCKVPTISSVQIFGRAVRTWFGMDTEFNFVSDVIEWLTKNYSNSSVFDELKEYFMNCNSHTFYIPNSEVYRQAEFDWTNPQMPYAASLEDSQFKGLYVADENSEHFKMTGDKIMSSPSQIERDLSYQSYREEVGHCEHHPDGSCKENVRKLDKFKNLSDEEFDVLHLKTLDVDHINGDRNDMRKENLQVGCKNVHSAKSILDGDHDPNKYKKT